MIKGVYAVQLKTADLDGLKKFYTKVLGLSVNHTCSGCAILEAGGAWLAIQKNSQAAKDLGETSPVSVAFTVDDVEAVYKKATGEGAKSAAAPAQEPWGAMTATVLDPDGNKVVLLKETGGGKSERCCARRDETSGPAPMTTKVPEPKKSPKPAKGKGKE